MERIGSSLKSGLDPNSKSLLGSHAGPLEMPALRSEVLCDKSLGGAWDHSKLLTAERLNGCEGGRRMHIHSRERNEYFGGTLTIVIMHT